jgi:hypothetical protein
MTQQDLSRIERALNLRLPRGYRELMLHYPFPPDSCAADCLLPDNPDTLIEHNRGPDPHHLFGDRPGPGPPPGNYFMIGSDCGEEWYYIDISRDQSPVFKLDLECKTLTVEAANLTEYVAQCWATEAEVRQDEETMARKRWWQFWGRA